MKIKRIGFLNKIRGVLALFVLLFSSVCFSEDMSELFDAIRADDPQTILRIIEKDGLSFLDEVDENGLSPIEVATQAGHLEMTVFLSELEKVYLTLDNPNMDIILPHILSYRYDHEEMGFFLCLLVHLKVVTMGIRNSADAIEYISFQDPELLEEGKGTSSTALIALTYLFMMAGAANVMILHKCTGLAY